MVEVLREDRAIQRLLGFVVKVLEVLEIRMSVGRERLLVNLLFVVF